MTPPAPPKRPADPPRRGAAALAAAALLAALPACGYHLLGRSAALPSGVQSIGVPTFVNRTNRPELEQRITEHVIDAFTTRGRLRILPSEEGAQAVLLGTILGYTSTPIVISQQGRATRYEILITARVVLSEVTTDRVLWHDDHFLFRRQYDIGAVPQAAIDQEIIAIDEVADDFAESVVTSILEGF